MGSFAVNRFAMNKGTGIRPGVWFFEEFMFSDSVFGKATVKYLCDARKLTKAEIAEGDRSKPYELEISEPLVVGLEVFDDDGNSVPMTAAAAELCKAEVLDAFAAAEDRVLEFEMGLL